MVPTPTYGLPWPITVRIRPVDRLAFLNRLLGAQLRPVADLQTGGHKFASPPEWPPVDKPSQDA